MNLVALSAFDDNYIWMLHDGRQAWVVDPGDETPVREALQAQGLALAGILVTHHHPDHVGGIDALRALLAPGGAVHGPAHERIPTPFVPHVEGDRLSVLGTVFEVLEVPGHTRGHVAYVECGTQDAAPAAPLLFCGDTLFSAGCGRLFEGTPAQMHASLARLAALPAATRVCCTHEYTLANLRFATAVEPGNAMLAAHAEHCRSLRAEGRPTLPSTIELELQINPFLRCTEPEIVAAARAHGAPSDDALTVFTALREWKNQYR